MYRENHKSHGEWRGGDQGTMLRMNAYLADTLGARRQWTTYRLLKRCQHPFRLFQKQSFNPYSPLCPTPSAAWLGEHM